MRLLSNAPQQPNNEELKQFSHWLLDIGDGKIGQYNDGFSEITIPDEFLIKNYDNPIHAIVEATYPSLIDNYSNKITLNSKSTKHYAQQNKIQLIINHKIQRENYSIQLTP